jgi:hypothetical protein
VKFLSDLLERWKRTGVRPPNAETNEQGWVTIERHDGSRMTLDPEMVDYLEHRGPTPTQDSLRLMLVRASRVQVVSGGDQQLLLEVSDPISLAHLRQSLHIKDGPAGHCMCLGDPWFRFFDPKGRQLAEISFHHGQSIRWKEWSTDAELTNGTLSLMWLAERGVTYPAEQYNATIEDAHRMYAEWHRWYSAMPECVQPLLEGQQAQIGQVLFVPAPDATTYEATEYGSPSSVDEATHRAVLHALAAAYPNSVDRARALFEWLGNGGSKWSGFNEYEELPEHYLMRIPLESLVAAVESRLTSDAQLAGAARFFAGYQFAVHRSQELQALPPALRARLLAEGLRVDDEDRHKRARWAFDRLFLAD